jgi:hypothetical protein
MRLSLLTRWHKSESQTALAGMWHPPTPGVAAFRALLLVHADSTPLTHKRVSPCGGRYQITRSHWPHFQHHHVRRTQLRCDHRPLQRPSRAVSHNSIQWVDHKQSPDLQPTQPRSPGPLTGVQTVSLSLLGPCRQIDGSAELVEENAPCQLQHLVDSREAHDILRHATYFSQPNPRSRDMRMLTFCDVVSG